MPEIETKIWMALKGRIEQAAGAMAVAYPAGELFTPPVVGSVRQPYLAVGFAALPPERVAIGSREAARRTGTLTLVRAAPLGPPLAAHIEAASQLLKPHFRQDTAVVFQDIEVSFPADINIQMGYRDEGYWRVPAIIQWHARATL
jgi:hypothetical protein